MRRILVLIAAASGWLLLGAGASVASDAESTVNAAAERFHWGFGLSVKQQTVSHGDYSLLVDSNGIPVPVTDLVDCSALPLPFILQIRGAFDFYAGVCDDAGGPGCDGKLIYVGESCLAELAANTETVGRITSSFGRVQLRICYDANEDGQCTASESVATGVVTMPLQGFLLDGQFQGPTRQIGVRTIETSRPFRLNGRRVRIPRNGTHVNVLIDVPPGPPDLPATPETCVGGVCGFVESGVSIGW